MVICAVLGCSNRTGRDALSFYSFPAIILNQCDKTRELSSRRRVAWLARVQRADLTLDTLKPYSAVCSKHFIEGKPSKLFDNTNPDWAPSVLMGVKEKPVNQGLSVARNNRRKNRLLNQKHVQAVEALPEVELPHQMEMEGLEIEKVEQGCQTDLTTKDIFDLERKYKNLSEEYQESNERLFASREKLQSLELTEDSFESNDEKTRFYTGLPTFALLLALFKHVCKYLPYSHRNSITQFQELLMFLMRLRLGLSYQDLGYRFGVSYSTASRICDKLLDACYARLGCLIVWPERENLHKTMPVDFKTAFGNKVAVIVDCFEVFVDRPTALFSRAVTWSQYKHHNTVKFLIGITPQGVISFISEAWGGRTSDKYLTEHSGLLKNLLPGDVVMADRGFDIADSLGFCCASLLIPAFTRGKSQLSAMEVHKTKKLANLRIHVERVIGLVRNKYQILKGCLQTDCLARRKEDEVAPIDKIVRVCCVLTNLCPSVVPME